MTARRPTPDGPPARPRPARAGAVAAHQATAEPGATASSVALHFFRLLTDHITRQGLALQALLEQAALPCSVVQGDEHGRVPYEVFIRLCEVAAQALQDPCLGLRLGQSIRPGHLGSHGYALMNCANALELARQSSRYSALTIDACHNTIELRDSAFVRVLHSNLPDGRLDALCEDLQHSVMVTFGRWITGRDDIDPLWVSFRHPPPADTGPYQTLFRCPVHFDAGESAIGVDMRLASVPLPQADSRIRRIMEDLCTQLLQQLGPALEPGWLSSARRAVLESLHHGVPEAPAVAESIGLAPDRLRALLAERGLSFRALVDQLRHSLALGYMADPELSLVDIAFVLGFSEQSAFQRAFKRWTGMTPGEHRRQRGGA